MLVGIMRRFPLKILAIFLLFASGAGNALAMDSVGTDAGREIVTTRHTITVKGAPLTYIARAGFIPLVDEVTGEVRAKIFFVSYTVEPRRGRPARPVTFYTNGGPTEPATLADFGPRLPKGLDEEPLQQPLSYQLADNQKTWLTFTDLVLIDPVGTGYSRAAKPEYAKQYYNVDGDAESIAQFIQGYLQRYDPAKRQPIFLAGWSYGSIRSVLIADIAKRHGFAPRGLILLASALGNQPRHGVQLTVSDLGYIQQLPTMTATAFFNGKLALDLQRNFDETLGQAEAWATNRYPEILAQADRLTSEQQQAAAAEMARLTGLSPEAILEHRFRIPPDAFLNELFREWPVFALSDSRLLSRDKAAYWMYSDWYLIGSSRYFSEELNFTSEIPYADGPGLASATAGWDCGKSPASDCYDRAASMNDIEMASSRALAKLQDAMRGDPSLRVMMAIGYFDFTCPYFGTKMAVGQLEPDLKARVTVTYLHAGHPLLFDVRPAVADFIDSTLATPGKND